MNIASIDVKDMLESESVFGLVFAENLFIANEPASPNDTVTIFDYSAVPPQLSLDGGGLETPSVQLRIRSTNFAWASTMAEQLKDYLHGRANETWNGTYYSVIYCTSGPHLLDWDANKRCRYVISFNLQRRASNEQ